ncbi:MAG TPA: peptidylprolyl isomerase [Polyangiaceae bacterium]|nr:peptidylprolyl isomerase [Polyangiaceae bacterium]
MSVRSIASKIAVPALGFLLLSGRTAHATVVERVIAIIEEHAILLSELRQRAKPFLNQLPPEAGAQRAAATSQLLASLLSHMIDEEMEHRAAGRSHVTVTAQEVEDALGRVAQQNGVSVEQLIAEAGKTGLDAPAYREEIRRQLLESKLLNLKVQGRIRITEEDTKALYHRLQLEARTTLEFTAAWIKVAVPQAASTETVAAKRKAAEALFKRAAAGEDFAALARDNSDDAFTKQSGGQLGSLHPGALPPEIDKALIGLDVGEVGGPVRAHGDFYVLKLLTRAAEPLPKFSEAVGELQNRAYMEKLDQAKRRWLDGLRKQSHVEVRL